MESNNKDNQTTVGGVTFGGVASSESVPPQMPNNPNLASNSNQTDPNVEAAFDQAANGFPTQPDLDKAPIPNNLDVNVIAPTHFDTTNTVRPIIRDLGSPNSGSNVPQPQPIKKQSTPEQAIKKFTTMSIAFGVLAGVFLIFSIIGLVYGINAGAKLAEKDSTIKNQADIIAAVEQTTGVSEINSPSDVPVYKAETGYIYLGTWGIKIQIPDTLTNVSYVLNDNQFATTQSICFNATQKGIQYFPAFADVSLNLGKMGCLHRYATSEGDFNPVTGISYGTKVFTYKDHSYFYTASTDYSKDAANLGLEHTAVQYIKNMLTDNVKQYE